MNTNNIPDPPKHNKPIIKKESYMPKINKKSKDYYIGLGTGLLISVAFNFIENIIMKIMILLNTPN